VIERPAARAVPFHQFPGLCVKAATRQREKESFLCIPQSLCADAPMIRSRRA
jgi:hypothetical protein